MSINIVLFIRDNFIMNYNQVLEDFKTRGIVITTPRMDHWAPEMHKNGMEFVNSIKAQMSREMIDANYEMFILCGSCEAFKKRLNGQIVDDWFTKENFGEYAQNYYDILERQNDLEGWQVKLKETFREMI